MLLDFTLYRQIVSQILSNVLDTYLFYSFTS